MRGPPSAHRKQAVYIVKSGSNAAAQASAGPFVSREGLGF